VELNVPIDDFNENNDILCDIRFFVPEAIPEIQPEEEKEDNGEENGENAKEETV